MSEPIMQFSLQQENGLNVYRICNDSDMDLHLDLLESGGDWSGIESTSLEDNDLMEDAIAFLVKVAYRRAEPAEEDNEKADDEMGSGINMESEGRRPADPRSLF